ncbi:MAG: hypothetical protein EOO77_35930 [Oxalobacteraceae bacterium]|nr:MAG: hypothetical protein EOO77_35930 [Oxalobacteraceae bacterium]
MAVAPFDQLSAATTLQTITGGFTTQFSPPDEIGISPYGEGWPYQYDPTSKTVSVVTGPPSSAISFVASEIVPTAPAGTVRYLRATGEQLNLTQPVAGGTALRWTRFIDHTSSRSGLAMRYIAVTGVPTPIAQIPTIGLVTFGRTVVTGDAYLQFHGQVTTLDLSPSTLTASIDYTTQRISFRLVLIGRSSAGDTTPLVILTGTTDFTGKALKFSNASATYSNYASFVIAAALFGTYGAEAGGVFQYRGITTPTEGTVLNLVGRLAVAN